ncbi:hypothetical protein INT48_006649 [Thamnidium elegans]|uniref:SWIRM domain-containing protein n=1 Tax=Thamnidium elegans TaxID=101142 RepID=A0A8H7VXS7_9FUNG|nr:hypothetical protein INT48_006649 [Thamnidium elegans]
MTYPSKSLRIMQNSYNPQYHQKGEVTNDSLMSPPLTPTEAHHPTLNSIESACWYYPKKRKEFITSYSKMVPFLRKKNDCDHGSMFALNVYRDLYLTSKGESKINKIKENDCAMSDKTVVPLSQKRKSSHSSSYSGNYIEEDKKTHKRKRVSSILPSGKEAALAFDSIDIDTNDQDFYPSGWVPLVDALDVVPVKVCAPLSIQQQPYHHCLHKVESSMASILRLSPIQYLRCKRTLILASRTLKLQQIPFTKSVAQKLCRVDVNKTSALWTAFGQLGWFDESN